MAGLHRRAVSRHSGGRYSPCILDIDLKILFFAFPFILASSPMRRFMSARRVVSPWGHRDFSTGNSRMRAYRSTSFSLSSIRGRMMSNSPPNMDSFGGMELMELLKVMFRNRVSRASSMWCPRARRRHWRSLTSAEEFLAAVPGAHETDGLVRVAVKVDFNAPVMKGDVQVAAEFFIIIEIEIGGDAFHLDVHGMQIIMYRNPPAPHGKGLEENDGILPPGDTYRDVVTGGDQAVSVNGPSHCFLYLEEVPGFPVCFHCARLFKFIK